MIADEAVLRAVLASELVERLGACAGALRAAAEQLARAGRDVPRWRYMLLELAAVRAAARAAADANEGRRRVLRGDRASLLEIEIAQAWADLCWDFALACRDRLRLLDAARAFARGAT